jgi:hypothetical protein
MADETRIYEEIAGETYPKPPDAKGVTLQIDHHLAKGYLSDKPHRRPARTRLQAAPTYERLRELAARRKPPQEWHDEPMGNE